MSLHPKLDRFTNPKRVRTAQNAVTGELEHTVLDAVQLGFERVANHAESVMAPLSLVERDRFLLKLVPMLLRTRTRGCTDSEAAAMEAWVRAWVEGER